MKPMTKEELINIIKNLDTTQKELSSILKIHERTLHRWMSRPESIVGPARQALRAFNKLQNYALPWRPSEIDLAIDF